MRTPKNKEGPLCLCFLVFITILFIILAYKLALLITPLTETQQLGIDFLNNPQAFETSLQEAGASDAEISHMYDVHELLKVQNILFWTTLLLSTLIITSYRKSPAMLSKLFFWGGLTTITLPLLVLLAVAISFQKSFATFHYLLFPQGNWQFPLDSFLISTYPESFFLWMAVKILVIMLLLGSIFIALGFFNQKKTNKATLS